jgi:4-amino-4-deoxy-L-arabinose transferase-like glycosyltransferase
MDKRNSLAWADPNARTEPLLLVGALILAFVLRALLVHLVPWQPCCGDDVWYFRTGVQLAKGLGYLNDFGQPTAYFPVGYPLTLAAIFKVFGTELRVAQYGNVFISVATMALTYALARACELPARTSLLAAAAWGFLPSQLLSPVVTMSEIPFTFSVTLGLVLLVREPQRWASHVLAGVVFGWATLIRPTALFVPFVVLLALTLVRQRPRNWNVAVARAFVVAGCLAATIAPWTYRNYKTFGTFVLVSTNGGENLLIGNNPASDQRHQDPATFYPRDVNMSAMPEIERDRIGGRLAMEYLRAHPLEALFRAPRKLWYMYRSDLGVTNWVWLNVGPNQMFAYYVSQALTELAYLLVLCAGAFWLVLPFGRRESAAERVFAAIAVAEIGYFSVITLVFFGNARYHDPLMPIFAIAAACCAGSAARRLRATPVAVVDSAFALQPYSPEIPPDKAHEA